jgi:hypothetical protein
MKVFILIGYDIFDYTDFIFGVYENRKKCNRIKAIEEEKAKTNDERCLQFRVEEWEVI